MTEVVQIKRWPRRLAYALISLLIFLAVLLVAGRLALRTGSGHAFITSKIEAMQPAGQRLNIEGLNGDVFGEFTITHIDIADKNGVWLSVENARVRWSPISLLWGHVAVKNISAAELNLLALPQVLQSGGQSKGNYKIKSLDVQGVDFPVFQISDAVLPQEQTLSVGSSLFHGTEKGHLSAHVTTIGGEPLDTIEADLNWSPKFMLSGDVKVVSLPGGVIATLLRLQADQPLTIDIETSGERQSLQTVFNGALGGETFATADLVMAGDNQEIVASINPDRIPVLQPYAQLFGSAIEVKADINRDTKDMSMTGTLRSDNLSVDADAVERKSGFEFSRLRVAANSPLMIFPDMSASVGSFVFDGRAVMTEEISASGQTSFENIVYNDYHIARISGPVVLGFKDGTAGFDIDLTGSVDNDSALKAWSGRAPKIVAAGEYSLDQKALSLYKGNIRVPGVNAAVTGNANFSEKQAKLKGTYRLNKAALGLSLPADISGTFTTGNHRDGIQVAYDGTAKNISTLPEPLFSLLGQTVNFNGNAILDRANTLRIPAFSASSTGLTVRAIGSRTASGQIEANIDYETDPFVVSLVETSGTDGEGKLSGTIEALEFDVIGTMSSMKLKDQTLSNLTYNVAGTKTGTATVADVALTGAESSNLVTLSAEAAYQNGAWSLSEIQSDVFGLSVSGRASGQGSALSRLRGGLKIAGDPSEFISAKSLDISIQLENERASFIGTIEGISAGPLVDGNLKVEAGGPRDAVKFSLNFLGDTQVNDINREAQFTLSGTGGFIESLPSVNVNLDGRIGQFPIRSSGPLKLRQTREGLLGAGHITLLGGAVHYDLMPQTSALQVEGEGLSLDSILAATGRPGLEGNVNFNVNLQAVQNRWDGELSADVSKVRQPGSSIKPLDLHIEAGLIDGAFTFAAASRNEAFGGSAKIAGQIDTQLRAPFVTWPPAEALNGTAVGNGEIGTIAELFMPADTNAEGYVDLNAIYSLPLDANGVVGNLTLTDGELESGVIGVHLIDTSFEAVFKETYIEVSNFAGTGSMSGTITGGGRMALNDSGGGAITLSANKLRVFQRPEGHADVSGDLAFTQSADTLKLTGTMIVDDAQVSLDKLPRAGRPTLDISFTSDLPKTITKVKHKTELDITIKSPGRIALRGRGVNASMAVDAVVGGPFEMPVLQGEASIVRGRFDFLGKRFEITDSRVIFRDKIADSRLEIQAVRETSDLKATVNITGTIDRPIIDLRSEPTMPEDEVLSYILFGRSAAQLTALETARMAAALAQLSGGGGFDLIGTLESSLGLDTLDFTQSSTGQTQLATGKYLSDNVYVEVRSSVDGSPGLAVEWTPKKNIAVEAETSPGEAQRVSVQWQKDFD